MAKTPILFTGWKTPAALWRFVLIAMTSLSLIAHAHAQRPDPSFQKSIDYFQTKNYSAGRDVLQKLVKKSPGNALYWFNLGNAHFMLENFKKAESCFLQVEKLQSPLAPAARLYRAKALRAQGEPVRALEVLQQVAAEPRLPASLKDAAERERSEIQTENELKRKTAALDFYRAEKFEEALSEVSAVPSTDDDTLFLKSLILLALNRTIEANKILTELRWRPTADRDRKEILLDITDRVRHEIEPTQTLWGSAELAGGVDTNVYPDSGADTRAAAVVKAFGNIGGRPWRQGPWSATTNARLEWSETLGLGDLKVLASAAQASVHYDTISSQSQLSAIAEYDFWANDPMLLKTGIRGRHKQYVDSYELSSDIELAKVSTQDNDISFLGGTTLSARIAAGRTFFPVYLELGIDFQKDAIGDQTYADGSVMPWAFQGIGPAFRLIWKADDDWYLSAQTNLRWREYPTSALPGNRHRADRETDFSATLTRILGPRLSAYFSATLVNNVSTLGSSDIRNENYSVQTAFIGILYDVRQSPLKKIAPTKKKSTRHSLPPP